MGNAAFDACQRRQWPVLGQYTQCAFRSPRSARAAHTSDNAPVVLHRTQSPSSVFPCHFTFKFLLGRKSHPHPLVVIRQRHQVLSCKCFRQSLAHTHPFSALTLSCCIVCCAPPSLCAIRLLGFLLVPCGTPICAFVQYDAAVQQLLSSWARVTKLDLSNVPTLQLEWVSALLRHLRVAAPTAPSTVHVMQWPSALLNRFSRPQGLKTPPEGLEHIDDESARTLALQLLTRHVVFNPRSSYEPWFRDFVSDGALSQVSYPLGPCTEAHAVLVCVRSRGPVHVCSCGLLLRIDVPQVMASDPLERSF